MTVLCCFYFSQFFNESFVFTTSIHFPSRLFSSVIFFAEGAVLKASTLSDNLNGNVLIHPEPGELPPMEKPAA